MVSLQDLIGERFGEPLVDVHALLLLSAFLINRKVKHSIKKILFTGCDPGGLFRYFLASLMTQLLNSKQT